MEQSLTDALSEYLGELMHKQENTFDWIEKEVITRKINAVYVLLDIDKREESWLEKVRKALTEK